MADKAKRKLTLRQQRFIAEFLRNGGNATRAARAAGYSHRGDRNAGYRLLTKVDVAEAIAEALHAQGVNPEACKIKLLAHAQGDIADYEPWLTGAVDLRGLAASGVDTSLIRRARVYTRTAADGATVEARELELYDAQGAVRELVRILGMVTQRHELGLPMKLFAVCTPVEDV